MEYSVDRMAFTLRCKTETLHNHVLTWYMASHLLSFFGRKPFLQIFKVLQGENSQNRLTWRRGHSSYDTTGFSILFVTPIDATFIRSRNSLVHFKSNTPIIAL